MQKGQIMKIWQKKNLKEELKLSPFAGDRTAYTEI